VHASLSTVPSSHFYSVLFIMGCDCWEWVHRAGAHPVVDAPMDDPNHFFRSSTEGPIALVTHVLTAQPCPTALYVPSPSRAQSPPLLPHCWEQSMLGLCSALAWRQDVGSLDLHLQKGTQDKRCSGCTIPALSPSSIADPAVPSIPGRL